MDKSGQAKVGMASVISAMFLVAGTCIGGGMLALPVTTGLMGFVPSLVLMVICWLLMTFTGLLFLEISLWLGEGAHVISMSSTFLGRWGKGIAWVLYLFICYASLVAYTDGGGKQIAVVLRNVGNFSVSYQFACGFFIVLFVGIVFVGSRFVGRINSILFSSMIVSYFALLGLGVSEVQPELLAHRQWRGSWMAVPVLLTAFSFQTMVPSLTPILKRQGNKLRIAIIGGSGLALVVYLVWQALVLGVVPVEGPEGLRVAYARGEPATEFFRLATDGAWISAVAEYFSFFALVTSFLGIALGLFDFLSDGLHIPERGWGKMVLAVLIIVPIYFITTNYQRVFLTAIDATGGFGDAVLNGMMPVMMVWIGRYVRKMPDTFRIPGGKPALVIAFILYLVAFGIELVSQTGWVMPLYDQPGTLDF